MTDIQILSDIRRIRIRCDDWEPTMLNEPESRERTAEEFLATINVEGRGEWEMDHCYADWNDSLTIILYRQEDK